MNAKRRINVSEQVFDGINEDYISELTDFLLREPHKAGQKIF